MKKGLKNTFIVLIIIVLIIVAFMFLFVGIRKNKIEKDTPYVEDNKNEVVNLKVEDEVPPPNFKAAVPIFMYHFILDDYGNYPDVENFLKPSTLEEQIKYIVENNYETIFVNEIEEVYKYTKPVALTFDDCFVYFYNNAFPLIKKYNVKATVNLIYNYMNGENYLTDAQVKEMIDSGLVSVESHTLSHRELTTISLEEQRKEILESKELFENRFGINLSTICYPVGDYNSKTIEISKEKYKYGLAMTGGVYYSDKHDLYSIPRIYANRSMPLSTFANYLKTSSVSIY